MKLRYLILSGGILLSNFLFSQDNTFAVRCNPPQAKIDLDINNVRACLMNAGDMWWDLTTSRYEIPKGGNVNSIFCGALWFGGLDDGGQLMTAAMTYRQTGTDFWTGPIDTANFVYSDSICNLFDRFWKLNRSEVEQFVQYHNDPAYTIPEAILTWPGNGNAALGHSHYLAPFKDVDGDGIYNPLLGDYPAFALNGSPNCNTDLLGDQAIWWVFNDGANLHTETSAFEKFGMEVRAMAFAYRTNNFLNDATMYRYQIINRSFGNWNQMWMGQFSDVDLGAYDDDYVGCDVSRGMGYGYNGDLDDGTSPLPSNWTYGEHPPAIGFDFLQGPLADANDLMDNDRDSILDESGERIKLSMFKCYNSDFTITGNPEVNIHFYYFLQGLFKDGSPMTYGGNGYGGSVVTKFMFPGASDPYGWGTGGVPQLPWSETVTPFDRRFIGSVGPFTMSPGEVETVVIGVPWARDTAGNNLDAITKLQQADDYLQQMFDNCFSLPCTTDAPPEFVSSVNGTSVFFTTEAASGTYSWNFGDNTSSTLKYPSHNFPGEGIFTVCLSVTNACGTQTVCHDIKIVVSHEDDCGPPVQRLEGKGSGFQTLDMMPESVNEILNATDQRSHFPWYKPIHAPVRVTYENYTSMVNGDYRIAFDSVTNSSHWKMWMVGMTDTVYSDSTISSDYKQIIPQWGLGVQMQQVPEPGFNRNPNKNGFLESTMTFADPTKNWLTGIADRDMYNSYNWIRSGSQAPGTDPPCGAVYDDRAVSGVFLDANEDFEKCVGGIWAPYRITSKMPDPSVATICYNTGTAYWPNATMLNNKIENLANVDVVITSDKTKWTRCAVLEMGINGALTQNGQRQMLIRLHPSVDKEGRTISQGGASDTYSPNASDYVAANGMSWFPGYAINIETGERLNMVFGENSGIPSENGRDMLWNPTDYEWTQYGDPIFGGMHYVYVFGHNGDQSYPNPYADASLSGILRDVPVYDQGRMINSVLSSTNVTSERTEVFRDAMWVSIPMLNPGHTLLETDVTIRLRVAKPFKSYNTSSTPENNDYPMYGFKIDKLNLNCNLYEGSVLVYPNPFDDFCTILFQNTESAMYNLKLYDVRGRLVRTYEEIHSDRIVVEGVGLEEGVYIYALQKEGEKPIMGKLIFR